MFSNQMVDKKKTGVNKDITCALTAPQEDHPYYHSSRVCAFFIYEGNFFYLISRGKKLSDFEEVFKITSLGSPCPRAFF